MDKFGVLFSVDIFSFSLLSLVEFSPTFSFFTTFLCLLEDLDLGLALLLSEFRRREPRLRLRDLLLDLDFLFFLSLDRLRLLEDRLERLVLLLLDRLFRRDFLDLLELRLLLLLLRRLDLDLDLDLLLDRLRVLLLFLLEEERDLERFRLFCFVDDSTSLLVPDVSPSFSFDLESLDLSFDFFELSLGLDFDDDGVERSFKDETSSVSLAFLVLLFSLDLSEFVDFSIFESEFRFIGEASSVSLLLFSFLSDSFGELSLSENSCSSSR